MRAFLRRSIGDAEDGLIVLDAADLVGDGAGGDVALGHILIAIHAADERVIFLAHPRQRKIHVEAQLGLEPVVLVPEQRRRDRALGLPIVGSI
jgi:hypothetical protein